MTDWTQFPAWKTFLGKDRAAPTPFAKEPITANSVFLYSEICAPLPCAGTTGGWYAYPGPREAAAHLLFHLLPLKFGIWLCRDEWSKGPAPIDLETLFAEAVAQNSRYAADLPAMQRVKVKLEAACKARSHKAALEALEAALRSFNRKWRRTPTWAFHLKDFRTPIAVAKDIARRSNYADLEPKQVQAWAAKAMQDPKAGQVLRKIIASAGVA